MPNSIWLGFDSREAAAVAVARRGATIYGGPEYPVHGVVLDDLREAGLYRRPTSRLDGRLYDMISEAPMATEHACARFLVPIIAGSGWALFTDGDVMFRRSLANLFALADPAKAVMCVHHRHEPPEGEKMDGQAQMRYARKNWSSVMLINCDHPANQRLTVEMVNEVPGRDLHRFCWLRDDEIGALPEEWNWLAGHSDPTINPAIVHFTLGTPDMPGYEDQPYADEWRRELRAWAA